jgi:hypothetical protein
VVAVDADQPDERVNAAVERVLSAHGAAFPADRRSLDEARPGSDGTDSGPTSTRWGVGTMQQPVVDRGATTHE